MYVQNNGKQKRERWRISKWKWNRRYISALLHKYNSDRLGTGLVACWYCTFCVYIHLLRLISRFSFLFFCFFSVYPCTCSFWPTHSQPCCYVICGDVPMSKSRKYVGHSKSYTTTVTTSMNAIHKRLFCLTSLYYLCIKVPSIFLSVTLCAWQVYRSQ